MGSWKSRKGVETDHTSGVIVRLEDRRALGPRHQTAAPEHSTLDHASVYSQVQFKNLIAHQKARQVLSPDMSRERLEPLRERQHEFSNASQRALTMFSSAGACISA